MPINLKTISFEQIWFILNVQYFCKINYEFTLALRILLHVENNVIFVFNCTVYFQSHDLIGQVELGRRAISDKCDFVSLLVKEQHQASREQVVYLSEKYMFLLKAINKMLVFFFK